jgi:hypothetical protein
MLKGGCFCGDIRYEADGETFHRTNCHCATCRRTTGAPFVAWFSVARTGFRFTQGYPTRFKSSSHGTRTFCPRCGSQLTFSSEDAQDEIDVTTCTLDNPEEVPPTDHTFTGSQLAWVQLADGLPRYAQSREASP